MSQLWQDHPATPKQGHLFRMRKRQRPTQADLLLDMLRAARREGRQVSLPEIMATRIAQHGARFNELRRRGFVIANELVHEGCIVHSRYSLLVDPERPMPPAAANQSGDERD